MKKIITILLCIITVFSLSACSSCRDRKEEKLRNKRIDEIIATFEKDDTYYYVLDEVTNTYHLCARIKPLTENLYTPVQFNGKRISRAEHPVFLGIGYNHNRITFSGFLSLDKESVGGNIKNLYYSDNINIRWTNSSCPDIAENQFFPYTQNSFNESGFIYGVFNQYSKNCYVTSQFFEKLCNEYKFNGTGYIKTDYNVTKIKDDKVIVLQKANVLFCYNNEIAENEYFIVDNKDGAYLINKPQYNPILSGFTFAGWYKEPECINAWDFANDLTPELEYDGDGKLVFKETKLYAKWI